MKEGIWRLRWPLVVWQHVVLIRALLLIVMTALPPGTSLLTSAADDQLWQQLYLKSAGSLGGALWSWQGDRQTNISGEVSVTGPGTIAIRTIQAVLLGSGSGAALTLSDLTLYFAPDAFASPSGAPLSIAWGPIPAIDGRTLKLKLSNVTILAPFGPLASVAGFWSSAAVLAAMSPLEASQSTAQPRLSDAPSRILSLSGPDISITNALLLPTDQRPAAADCYSGGVPVYDSLSLYAALASPNTSSVFVYQNLLLSPTEFSFRNQINITGGRSVEVYGCPGTVIDTNYNWTRFSILTEQGGSIAFRNLTFTNTPTENQLFWPRRLAPLLGLVYGNIGGKSSLASCTIISSDQTELTRYMETFSNLSAAARPDYSVFNASAVFITRWRLTGGDVWPYSPGVTAAEANASVWELSDVTVSSQPFSNCLSSGGFQGIRVSSGAQLRQLIGDAVIPALEIVNNIVFLASEWPPEASGPAGGQVFVNATKEIYACHPVPGQRYSINFGDLGQVVFVFGTLLFRGALLMTNPRASPRRSWLWHLIGALSVETDGVILFERVAIHSTVPHPFMNADDPFWSISCGSICDGFIPGKGDYLNVTYYNAFLFEYKFFKTEWVAVSQGRNITGAGYWGYTDVGLSWQPAASPSPPPPAASPPPPAPSASSDDTGVPVTAVAVPVAVGGALLLAAIIGLIVWYRRRAADAASAKAASVPYRTSSGHSSGRAGTVGMTTGSNESSLPLPMGASGTPPIAASTTFSQATSLLSASAPTQARIEDMKRAITSQAALQGTHRNEQITLTELLGEGTFGKVYKGTWRGTTVAVKTMVLPTNMSGKEKREKMAVMETAISSSLSHPNIVQTYTYAVTPVKGDGNLEGKLSPGGSLIVDSTATALATTDTSNIHSWEVRLVLEYCDLGSLRDVMNAALMTARQVKGLAPPREEEEEADGGGGGESAPDASRARAALDHEPAAAHDEQCPLGYAEVLDTCLDVARAMLHMHSENIVHGDLKARNILLKSGGTDGRSCMAKVADFGLSLRIDPQASHVSNVYQGTITHMAPEVLLHGKVSKMSDVYAFAILMWETYTAGQAFKGTPRALLGHEVTKMGRRPPFPLDTPFEFQLLACRCWESDPSIRPTFEQIIGELSRMRGKLAGTAVPPAASTSAGLPIPPFAPTVRVATDCISSGLSTDHSSSAAIGATDAAAPGGTGGYGALPTVAPRYKLEGAGEASLTLEESGSGMPGSSMLSPGLFVMQGIDGSSMATTAEGGATGGFGFAIFNTTGAGGQAGAGHPRGPAMPPILEGPGQQQH